MAMGVHLVVEFQDHLVVHLDLAEREVPPSRVSEDNIVEHVAKVRRVVMGKLILHTEELEHISRDLKAICEPLLERD